MKITNEELHALIPNIIPEVDGEKRLDEKLAPWIDSAEIWLVNNIIGANFKLPDSLVPLAKKIIAVKAFASAVPSLDLSLTPAGFSVISTEGRVPASKERIERLISSLLSSVDDNLPPFLNSLLELEDWRSTAMGDYWLATFLYGLEDARLWKKDKDILSTYQMMRQTALRFQDALAQRFLGNNVLHEIRTVVFEPGNYEGMTLWYMLHRSTIKYITYHDRNMEALCPDDHVLWHYAQPMLGEIRTCERLYRIWEEEMGDQINVEPFKNTVKGGFFF